MVSEEQLDKWRIQGVLVLVRRDGDPANDVRGIIVAWDEQFVLVRKQNRKLIKLERGYTYESISAIDFHWNCRRLEAFVRNG